MSKSLASARSAASVVALCAAIAAVLGVASPALAEPGAGTTFYAGAEFDDQDSQRFDAGLSFLSDGGTGVDLAGSWTESDWSEGDLSSNYLFGLATHDFGRFGLGAGGRYIRDEDLTETLGLVGAAFMDLESTRLTATVEARNTDFDEAPFTATGEDIGQPDITSLSGTAKCSVDSLGFGLALDASFDRWSFYAAVAGWDYDSESCAVEVTSIEGGTSGGGGMGGGMGGNGTGHYGVQGPMAMRLVSGAAAPLAGYSWTLVPREAALLESSIMAGAGFEVGSRGTLGVEFYHEAEEFAPIETDTLLGYWTFDLSESFALELSVGVSDTDGYDQAAFLGLRFYASMGD